MAHKRPKAGLPDKVEQNMTPMIDIVFQLMAFFLMTLRINALEGDLNITMPLGQSAAVPEVQFTPIKLRLIADKTSHELTQILMNDTPLAPRIDAKTGKSDHGFGELRDKIIGQAGNDRGPQSVAKTAEVELDCDYELKYEYVIRAFTAVSGYREPNGNIVHLMEKVKFAQPRKPQERP